MASTLSPPKPASPPRAAVPWRVGPVRSHVGALCYRMGTAGTEVLLITTRGKGHWAIPKGWPMPGLTPAEAASVEAYEEAGAMGAIHPLCLGQIACVKTVAGAPRTCVVGLYALQVTRMLRQFPERGQRKRRWLGLACAADLVAAPDLARLIAGFEPDALPPAHPPRRSPV